MPDKFKLYCPQVRVIIDCTEIRCEMLSSLSLQSETFSNYKHHTTFKGLIGIAPCGVITFVSKLYTGSISDIEITRQLQILQLLQPGDGVMADKGFQIEKMLTELGATCSIYTALSRNGSCVTSCEKGLLEYFIRPKKNNIFSELLAFWKVYSFTEYVLNTW